MAIRKIVGGNMLPETKYAKSEDVNIAYQVTGEGPFDILLLTLLFICDINLS